MTQFQGTHQTKRDGKGRVSIPAEFRALLKTGEGAVKLILRPSIRHACIEGWTEAGFAAQTAPLARLAPFSDDEEDFSLALFSDVTELEADGDGRIVIPRKLAEYAALGEQVSFIGARTHFQIWEPVAGERRVAEARARARALRMPAPGGTAEAA